MGGWPAGSWAVAGGGTGSVVEPSLILMARVMAAGVDAMKDFILFLFESGFFDKMFLIIKASIAIPFYSTPWAASVKFLAKIKV